MITERKLRFYSATGKHHSDDRTKHVVDLATVFPLPAATCKEAWERRKYDLRRRILVAAGLVPMPEKSSIKQVVTAEHSFDGFKVQNVYFESLPGLYVTGNLYIPNGLQAPAPAILHPHGHWDHGRLESSAITDIPTRCANYARRGFISFSFDMIGYGDSLQLDHDMLPYEAELWGMNLFGLQLWNAMRALDYIAELPEVDEQRIGCTGASGGATQTIFLAAIDDRVRVSVPVNMVSNRYQGGCYCENQAYLRIDANNVDYAAAMAPRPMLLVGCSGDWTRNLMDEVLPAIHSIYSLYGAGEQVEGFFEDTDHNYNRNARMAAYRWFTWHLQAREDQEAEWEFRVDPGLLRVFPDKQLPEHFLKGDALVEALISNRLASLENETPDQIVGAGLEIMTGAKQAAPGYRLKQLELFEEMGLNIEKAYAYNDQTGASVHVVLITMKNQVNGSTGKAKFVVGMQGKRQLLTHKEQIADWLINCDVVVYADLFLTGEYHAPYAQVGRSLSCPEGDHSFIWRSHFTTYNYTDDAYRIQDIAGILHILTTAGIQSIEMVALEGAKSLALIAAQFSNHAVVECDSGSVTATDSSSMASPSSLFLPGWLALGGDEVLLETMNSKICKN